MWDHAKQKKKGYYGVPFVKVSLCANLVQFCACLLYMHAYLFFYLMTVFYEW